MCAAFDGEVGQRQSPSFKFCLDLPTTSYVGAVSAYSFSTNDEDMGHSLRAHNIVTKTHSTVQRHLYTSGALTILACSVALLLTACLSGNQDPDPVVEDFAIAYVKRPLPVDDDGEPLQADIRRPLTFNAGGDLYVRDRASPSATERNVTFHETGGLGDVKDVEVSFDGTKLIFAMRAPEIEGADDDEQPTWNIWEYNIEDDVLSRIISSDIRAEEGQDVAPHYLPDGRIIFSSTRQRQANAILLDEGKPQFAALDENRRDPALVLHVMGGDGSDITQVSFNQSHDFDPSVLANGKVLFSRWDNMGSQNAINLYTMNPDGTELEILYGAHSHETGTDSSIVQFLQPRERADGGLLTILKPFSGTYSGGDIVFIDVANYVDNDQPTWSNQGILTGSGQSSASLSVVRTDTALSPGGRFSSAYPFWDGTDRALISWSPCRVVENETLLPCTEERLTNPNVEEAAPLYGVYLYDFTTNTQLPIVVAQETVMVSEVVAAQPRDNPEVIVDQVAGLGLNADYVEEGVGVLHIRSAFDYDGVFNDLGTSAANIASVADFADPAMVTADQRPARFLRIVKAVSIPDDDVADIDGTAFGRSRQQLMREILGYAPIEPDGSVMIKVPANVPLAISVLDKNGRRLGARHQNWLQVRPGETVECSGCHIHDDGRPHGHAENAPTINSGASTSGLPFPNTEPEWLAEMGETMAQTRARISCLTDCAALTPSVNINFDDVWTNTNIRDRDESFSYQYSSLTTSAPTTGSCQTDWTNICRIIINYEQHIHPLWTKTRQLLDNNGDVVTDNTCTSCHGPSDSNGDLQVPAAQLDLTDGLSSDEPDHFNSYRELLFSDNEVEVVEGTLQDRLIQATDANGNPRFEIDDSGNLILDANGDPVPVLITVNTGAPSMSVAGALASPLPSLFDSGGSHEGRLDPAELRLISEWLDIGAQYYNNPFDAPADD